MYCEDERTVSLAEGLVHLVGDMLSLTGGSVLLAGSTVCLYEDSAGWVSHS